MARIPETDFPRHACSRREGSGRGVSAIGEVQTIKRYGVSLCLPLVITVAAAPRAIADAVLTVRPPAIASRARPLSIAPFPAFAAIHSSAGDRLS
jgi:hypothetical protein